MSLLGKKILVLMSGSIAGFKACALISKMTQAGAEVQVVMSASALQFIGPSTIEGLTGRKALCDLWDRGEAMAHIQLMRWSDLIIALPATAHLINRLAHGLGDDLLTTLFLAHDFKKPFLIAPAMNTAMYLHPTTQDSLKKLKSMGIDVLETASGVLACKEEGLGRLLDPELILQEVTRALQNLMNEGPPTSPARTTAHSLQNKILITFGGTQEPIDAVRVISNTSTGASGAALCDQLEVLGFQVVALAGRTAVMPKLATETSCFSTANHLAQLLKDRLSKGDIFAVIHMAAVSDFQLSNSQSSLTKLDSQAELVLRLVPTMKIAPQIRSFSPLPLHLTTYKLTATQDQDLISKKINRLQNESQPDLIVHNDLSEIANQKGQHPLHLFQHSEKFCDLEDRSELAGVLMNIYFDWLKSNTTGGLS